MKKQLSLLLVLLLLCGCSAPAAQPSATATAPVPETAPAVIPETAEIPYESRFDSETVIRLVDSGMDVTGPNSLTVFGSHDIVYYEDKDTYESGNPYGEGQDRDKHSPEEAERHYVVNITEPGAYRVTGRLPYGQIRIDLGEKADEDENAVVELILDNADIGCTVAPAILFQNVYECDGDRKADNATADVDTSAAGANLILQGENTVTGSYVAKIFKDKDGEKKLWKQDGAIYSYMSMNVFGPGKLTLNADNEGMDTELHLTVNGGDITILSGNDGINTNEDGVSVTTVNAGRLHIVAGLGEEGDGIDSNGYLVINGGTVISAAKPQSDSGLDSDLGSYIHGGTVVALGAAMDWAESDSGQVTVNLQFNDRQNGALQITAESGGEVFTFDPASDPVLKDYSRGFQGVVVSCPAFRVGDSYEVSVAGVKMMYTGTDVMGHGPGGMGPNPPGGFGPSRPEGEIPTWPEGEMPTWPEGEMPTMPEGGMPPEGFGDREPPQGFDGQMPTRPAGEMPEGGFGGGFGHGGRGPGSRIPEGEGNTLFYMQDKVNFFSGITAAE